MFTWKAVGRGGRGESMKFIGHRTHSFSLSLWILSLGGGIMSPQRSQCPGPGNLRRYFITGEGGIKVANQRTLGWGLILAYPGGPNSITSLKVEEEGTREAQRDIT